MSHTGPEHPGTRPLTTIFGGWAGLLWAVLFGTLGGVVGAHLDGTLDLRSLLRGRE